MYNSVSVYVLSDDNYKNFIQFLVGRNMYNDSYENTRYDVITKKVHGCGLSSLPILLRLHSIHLIISRPNQNITSTNITAKPLPINTSLHMHLCILISVRTKYHRDYMHCTLQLLLPFV